MSDREEEERTDGATASEVEHAFPNLADLDEDLRTMAQSSAEVERWRRISTRGLTPSGGLAREEGGLAAPIVSSEGMTAEARRDPHAATTAPGSITAPDPEDERRLLAPRTEDEPADHTRRLPALPEGAALAQTVRRSFAPPRDSASAPPGSRVVLPRSSHPPERISSRPVVVPRPSQPPPEDDDGAVRGWRPEETAAESDEPVAKLDIPRPAPLPGAHRASSARAPSPAATPGPTQSPTAQSPTVRAEDRPTLESTVEISGTLFAAVLVAALVIFFGLFYLLFL